MAIFLPWACGTRYRCFCSSVPQVSSDRQFRPGVHRHDDAQRRVDVFEFLAGQAERDVVHPGAAVLDGHRDAEQAELGHLRQDVLVEAVRAVEFLDARRNLTGAPLAHGLLEQALFVGQVEVDHGEWKERIDD